MRRREYYWSLHDTKEKNSIHDLRTDQVEAVFAAVPVGQRKHWMIWREGFAGWKPFVEFQELVVQLRDAPVENVVRPPKPPAKISEINNLELEMLDKSLSKDLAIVGAKQAFHRGTSRRPNALDVRIRMANGDKFKTSTQNISLHGMQLSDPLPDGLPRYFHVELKNKGESISVLCSVVGAQAGKDSGGATRLKIEANDFYHLLKDWLFKMV